MEKEAASKELSLGDVDAQDVRSELQREAQPTLSPKQNRRLLIKTNLVILPIMTIATTLAILDKISTAFAAVYGMNEDTNLKNQEYSWLGSIFYFGYMAMEVPALWMLTKVPMGRIIPSLLTLWGIAIMAMGACNNFAGLAAIRFLLGVFEASLLPCCMLLTSIYYRREEQALVTAVYFNTFAGIFGSILSYAIGHIDGALSPWRYLFLIYGATTVAFGIITWFALPNVSTKAWFFNAEDRKNFLVRTVGNQTGVHTVEGWKFSQILEAVKDPKYWVIAVSTVAFSITNAGITNFNPLIIKGYGFSPTKTSLMSSPQAAIAFTAQFSTALAMLYFKNVRCLLWSLASIPAIAGTAMVHTLDHDKQRDASLAGVYLLGFYTVSCCTMLSLQSSNNAGVTKKSFAAVSWAVYYSLGNIIGPQFFRTEQAPIYQDGIIAMMVGFSINLITPGIYAALCWRENRRRDSLHGKPTDEAVSVGLEVDNADVTDGDNPNFRYVY